MLLIKFINNMRLVSFFTLVTMAAVVAVGSTSCKDDEKGKKGTAADEIPTADALGLEYPIVGVTGMGQFTMDYSRGRLVGGTFRSNDFTVTSDPLEFHFDSGCGSTHDCTDIRVNEAGYIVYMEELYADGSSYRHSISYNGDGRVSEVYSTYVEEDEDYRYEGSERDAFHWEGGRLMSVETEWNDTEIGSDYRESYKSGASTEYEYGYECPNTGVYYVNNDNDLILVDDPIVYSGLLGRPADYLPTSYTSTEYDIVDGQVDVYYEYSNRIQTEYDGDRVRRHGSSTFTYLDETGGYYSMKAAYPQAKEKLSAGQRAKMRIARMKQRR